MEKKHITILVAIAVIIGSAYLGYQIYTDNNKTPQN